MTWSQYVYKIIIKKLHIASCQIYTSYEQLNGAFTHTLRWDGMRLAALVTQYVNASIEIH